MANPGKPKVLYVITSSGVGGAERTLFNLVSRLDPAKVDIAGVVSLKPCGEYAEKIRSLGIPVQSLDMGYLPSFGDTARLTKLIRESGADTVHAFLFRAIQFCRLAKASAPFRLISSPRVNYRTRAIPLIWLDMALKRRDDLTLCESESSAVFLTRELCYNPDKVSVIRNGLDTAFWQFSDQTREAARRELGLGKDTFFIFSSGRLDKQKGYEYLLKALPQVSEKIPDFRLAIAGEGPLESGLKKLAQELGFEENVLFLGKRGDIPQLLCAADAFALPSLWEGLPNSLLEAMSAGRACAASGVDGTREVVEDGVNGLLTDPADSHSIAQALLKLGQDPALRARLGAAAREKAVRDHSFGRMMAQYEAAYTSEEQ